MKGEEKDMQTFTIEGIENWNGDRFYFLRGGFNPGQWFTKNPEKAERFDRESQARAVAELLVALSKRDPFLGYESADIVMHDTDAAGRERSTVVGTYDFHYYRAP